MDELLQFVLKGILENENFKTEVVKEDGRVVYSIQTKSENMGLIIGKGGKTIKALQEILRIRGKLEKTLVFLNVVEEK